MEGTRALALGSALFAAGLACNLQAVQNPELDAAGTGTAAALTLGAPTSSDASVTGAVPSGADVRVISVTNCLAGPSSAFDLIFTAGAGQRYRLVGKNSDTNHWIVVNPIGGTCWLSGRDTEAIGNTSYLPEYPLPAAPSAPPVSTPKPTRTSNALQAATAPRLAFTPTIGVLYTPGVPNFPTYFIASPSCALYVEPDGRYFIQATTFSWRDNADNEAGYRLYGRRKEYISAGLVADLGPNVTHYTYSERYHEGLLTTSPYAEYNLYAFNDVGESIHMGLVLDYCR